MGGGGGLLYHAITILKKIDAIIHRDKPQKIIQGGENDEPYGPLRYKPVPLLPNIGKRNT